MTSGIPNLQLDSSAFNIDGSDFLKRRKEERYKVSASKRECVGVLPKIGGESGEKRKMRTKSTPMVEMKDSVKVLSAKRSKREDFPTPESPMRRSLKR